MQAIPTASNSRKPRLIGRTVCASSNHFSATSHGNTQSNEPRSNIPIHSSTGVPFQRRTISTPPPKLPNSETQFLGDGLCSHHRCIAYPSPAIVGHYRLPNHTGTRTESRKKGSQRILHPCSFRGASPPFGSPRESAAWARAKQMRKEAA